jgi:hypothetical protein
MGQFITTLPVSPIRRRPRPRLARAGRRPRPRLEPKVVIQPGGMVELALSELGAVLVRVLPPEA